MCDFALFPAKRVRSVWRKPTKKSGKCFCSLRYRKHDITFGYTHKKFRAWKSRKKLSCKIQAIEGCHSSLAYSHEQDLQIQVTFDRIHVLSHRWDIFQKLHPYFHYNRCCWSVNLPMWCENVLKSLHNFFVITCLTGLVMFFKINCPLWSNCTFKFTNPKFVLFESEKTVPP